MSRMPVSSRTEAKAEGEKHCQKSKQIAQGEKEKDKKRAHHSISSDSAQIDTPPSKRPRTADNILSSRSVQPDAIYSDSSELRSLAIDASTHAQPDTPLISPFHLQTASFYLPLSSILLLHPLSGLCAEHLSPLLLKYYSPLQGVIISYHNPRLSGESIPCNSKNTKASLGTLVIHLARSVDEYAASYIWLTADFLLFQPRINDFIQGWINLQNDGQLGLVCWNLFNASIPRARLPEAWKWSGTLDHYPRSKARLKADGRTAVRKRLGNDENNGLARETTASSQVPDEQSSYENENGTKVEGLLAFYIFDVEISASGERERNYLSIEGDLTEKWQRSEEAEVGTDLVGESSKAKKKKRRKQKTTDNSL